MKLIEAQMDKAEKKRLLYVAATRARDHLIISGSLKSAKLAGEHWLGRIASALDVKRELQSNRIHYQNGSVDWRWHDADAFEILLQKAQAKSRADCVSPTAAANQNADATNAFPLLRSLEKAKR
jgi:ATP-dependent exoDNAse (exonuclease V) beta subunit